MKMVQEELSFKSRQEWSFKGGQDWSFKGTMQSIFLQDIVNLQAGLKTDQSVNNF